MLPAFCFFFFERFNLYCLQAFLAILVFSTKYFQFHFISTKNCFNRECDDDDDVSINK